MERLRIITINPGDCYDRAIFLPSGQKLIAAGTTLTPRHVQALRRQPTLEVILAHSLDELVNEGLLGKLDSQTLKVGQRADYDVLGAGGTVLVEKGEQIESHHIDALSNGGYRPSASEATHAARLRKDRIVMADELVDQLRQQQSAIARRISPEEYEVWGACLPSDSAYPKPELLVSMRLQLGETLRDLYARVEAGMPVSVGDFEKVVEQLWPMMIDYRCYFTQLALIPRRRDDYLPDHALCVCVLSMATAAQLSWSEEHIRLTGLIALLFDMGMLLVPLRIRTSGIQLSEIDRKTVQRHTIYSLAMVETIDGVSDEVKLAAYQHHEREDGSGYPEGVRGGNISDLARVIAICDVFAALTNPRNYRKDFLPYVAMEQVILASGAGQFHKPSTRALVQAAGLFPVGSFVKLSDGNLARIFAANPSRLDRPVIQLFNPGGQPTDQLVDLALAPADRLSVSCPMPAPSAAA